MTKEQFDALMGGIDNMNALLSALVDEAKKRPEQAKATGARPAATPAASVAVFGNYGRSKGAPVAGASEGDLTYYGNGCVRSLNDDDKARFHDKERALLTAIVAEMDGRRLDVPEDFRDALDEFGPAPQEPPPASGPTENDIPF